MNQGHCFTQDMGLSQLNPESLVPCTSPCEETPSHPAVSITLLTPTHQRTPRSHPYLGIQV